MDGLVGEMKTPQPCGVCEFLDYITAAEESDFPRRVYERGP